ncbi:Kelch-like protein 1 [Taenia crassiceps]|uniref:Kelch-like protein 1 n=1 Tax=Taenia crassiceps TaxID=6207 RepID=A0ABR4Q336_9CEST
MWSCSPKLKGKSLTYDVTLRFQNSSLSCEKSIFASASSLFKQIFDAVESGGNPECSLLPAIKVCSNSGSVFIDLEESYEAFEAIHRYLHNPVFEVDLSLLPSVCKITKKYQFHSWRTFGELLAKSISLENIGEVCPLVIFSCDQVNASPFIEDATSQELASAARSFLISNADAIASSQTGQLSARLFIDVIEGPQSPQHESCCDVGPFNDADDWALSERVLFYCSRRIQDREPLNEGNCGTFEDKAARRLNNRIHAPASDTVTDEIRMTISDAQLVNFGKSPSSQLSLTASETGEQKQVAEVGRQMSGGIEVVLETPSSPPSSVQPMSPVPLQPNRLAFFADKETCLLARTSLGAGAISIHLGKLEGRLVSISLKRRRAPSGPGSSASSSVAGGGGVAYSTTISFPTSIVLPPSPPPVNTTSTTVVMPSTNSTLAVASRRPAYPVRLGVFLEPLRYDHYSDECSPSGCIHRRGSILRSFGCLPTPLLEARSAAGACVICSTIEDGDDEESRMMSHFILIAGGTSQNRCLSSTELLCISRPFGEVDSSTGRRASVISANSDFESVSNFGGYGSVSLTAQSGPAMRSPRGRLALAALGKDCVYACGGCDGTNDLATVECLSFDSKAEYYKKWRFVSSMQQERSCCAVATWADESRIVVMGGQCEGSPLSSVEVYCPDSDRWLSLPPMSEARSQLCAASLSQRNLIVAVGGVSETASTPSTQPFKTSIPSIIECTEFSPSGEAYDPRCAHWIRLPELLNRGPLIGAALVPLSSSSGRLLLIGGSDGLSTITQTQIFDSRTWTWLPGPSLSTGRASPCAVSLTPPSTLPTIAVSSGVPCIAVIGGYNLAAGGFLNSVEIVGVAGSSGQISPLNVPSSTPPRVAAFASASGVSAGTAVTPLCIPAHQDTSPPLSPPSPSLSRIRDSVPLLTSLRSEWSSVGDLLVKSALENNGDEDGGAKVVFFYGLTNG